MRRRDRSMPGRNARAGKREKVVGRKHVRGFWGKKEKGKDR